MPVRSSVCTYSPATNSHSKYSASILPAASPLGHYRPLAGALGSTSGSYATGTASGRYSAGGSSTLSRGNSHRYSLSGPSSSSSLYSSPISGGSSSSAYSSLGSTSSHLSSSGSYASTYRPLGSSATRSSALGSRSTLGSSYHPTTSRYSSASSSSSLSSIGSSSSPVSSHYHQPASSSSLSSSLYSSRRLSHSVEADDSNNEKLPEGVPRGLLNLGNTCYMNSVLQALYSIDSVRQLALRARHDKPLASELSDLFKSMKNSRSPVSAQSFKYSFSRYQPKFSGLNQQDAQEFLRYLINGVHEEFNLAGSERRPRRGSLPKAPKSAQEAWAQYRQIVDDSPLVDLVVGQLCSTIICSQCQAKSRCWDPFWDLSLPLARGRHSCRLAQVIDDFRARETLDGDERPMCSNCKRLTRSSKQIDLSRLPPVIILHLKRFTNDGYKMSQPEVKIDDLLRLSSGGDCSADGSKQQTTNYQLKACVSHHGHSASSGHYTSHCKYANKWFHFNDDRVRDVTSSFDSSSLSDAYVLFYTQTNSDSRSDQSKL